MKPVFFMHIPKTGGTSIHHALAPVYGPCLFYPPLASDEQQRSLGKNFSSFSRRYAEAGAQEREGLKRTLHSQPFIGGHTDASLLAFVGSERFVFTCLRDPVDRLVSYYFHAVHPESPKQYRRYGEETAGMDFFEFLGFEPLRPKIDNQLTRFLSGSKSKPAVDEADLAVAMRTLERLDKICFQDRLDRDLAELGRALGIGNMEARALKIGRSRKEMEAPAPSRSDPRVTPYVQYDYLLYQAALDRRGSGC